MLHTWNLYDVICQLNLNKKEETLESEGREEKEVLV